MGSPGPTTMALSVPLMRGRWSINSPAPRPGSAHRHIGVLDRQAGLGDDIDLRTVHKTPTLSMKYVPLAMVAAASLLTGCAFNTSPYGASVKNVESIKSTSIKPIAVAQFKSAKPGLTSIACRAAGPVTVVPSFESYIEKAFIDELKLAQAYDPASNIVLSGRLDEVDFSSGMTDGNWTFTLAVSNGRNESFTTKSKFSFSGSFVADRACQEVAQAFGPAVQKLIGDVVQNPKFKQLAN